MYFLDGVADELLPQTPAPGVPPLTSSLPFDDSPAGVAAADRPGNAARVAYHGLGQSGDFHTATAAEIHAMAERVLGDPDVPGRVAVVQAALRELEESRPGLALVERLLSSR